jgi:hypothetical protein
MAAPLVMGFLGRSQKKESLDVGALASLLGQLLDADGDGDIADDVAKIGGGLLSKLFGRKR